MSLRQLHDDLWVTQRPLSFLGLELGTRMTVIRFGEDLLLHSPIAPDDALLDALAELGQVRWVIGPNRFHHLYLGHWVALGAEAWGVPCLHRKRTDLAFAGAPGADTPWPDALVCHPVHSIPLTEEAVFFHRPSQTLIVSDLLFNLQPDAPWLSRAALWVGGGYPGICCTVVERLAMKRSVGREDLTHILGWDFERVVLAHGAVVEEGGNDALRAAYRWLGL